MIFFLYITTQEGLYTCDLDQILVVAIFQSIVNITHNPVSTESISYMCQESSQNREMSGSCSEYSQVTSAGVT